MARRKGVRAAICSHRALAPKSSSNTVSLVVHQYCGTGGITEAVVPHNQEFVTTYSRRIEPFLGEGALTPQLLVDLIFEE